MDSARSLKVEMCSGHSSRRAHCSDRLPLSNHLTFSDINSIHVVVHGFQSLSMINNDQTSVEKEVTDETDASGSRCLNWGAGWGRDICS